MKHPELFQALGIEPPKGVLLHGPPGTGKTLLAKAVANEAEANFMLINGPEIMNKFYGESEKRIKQIFEEASEKAPSIIFIDEIDSIASKREETHGEVERRVVAQLLTMMDGLNTRGNVVVIGATNRPNSLDEALRRPGRFDREITFGVPDQKGRLEVLKIHTRNMPLEKDVDLKEIARLTHGFVGADLQSLAKEAAMNVLKRNLPKLKVKEKEKIPQEFLEKLRIEDKDFRDALKPVCSDNTALKKLLNKKLDLADAKDFVDDKGSTTEVGKRVRNAKLGISKIERELLNTITTPQLNKVEQDLKDIKRKTISLLKIIKSIKEDEVST